MNKKLQYIIAARQGDLAQVKELVESGVPLDSYQNGALLESSYMGHTNIVAYLISSGIEINKNNGLEVAVSTINKHDRTTEYLIRKGANVVKIDMSKVVHKDRSLTEIIDYLIMEGNYLVYANSLQDRSIIDWCENYIIKEELY
jgi:ankyrin repeat protein